MAAPRERCRVLGFGLEGEVVIGDRVVVFPESNPSVTAGSCCPAKFWIEPNGFCQIDDGLGVFLNVGPELRSVDEQRSVAGVEQDRLVVVVQCVPILALMMPSDRAVVVCMAIFGIETNGLGQVGDRLVELAKISESDSAIVIGTLVSRIKADGLVVVGNRLVVILLVLPGQAAAVIPTSFSRLEPDKLIEVGDGLFVISSLAR